MTGKLAELAEQKASLTFGQGAPAGYEALREPQFWRAYEESSPIMSSAVADRSYAFLKEDTQHPSYASRRSSR
jgi:hypothetical protein